MSHSAERRAPMGALTALRPSAERTRRNQLLEAADRLVVHYGPNKTTVADIAREAGVAVGSVYLEFAGKSEILGALSGWRLEGILDAMRAAVEPDPERPDRVLAERICDALEARTRAFVDLMRDGRHAESLLHCGCDGVAGAWQRFEIATAQLMTEALEALSAPADLPPAAHRAEALLRAYAAFTPPSLCAYEADALQAALQGTRALVLNGLRPR